MARLLCQDAAERLTARQAMEHPWFQGFTEQTKCIVEMRELVLNAYR